MPAYAPLIDLAGLDPGDGYFILGPRRGAASGWSVTAGDLNRDHLSDLMIGSPVAEGGLGMVHVVFGRSSPPAAVDLKALPPAGGFAVTGPEAEVNLGTSGAVGDLNGDGWVDLVMAARFADDGLVIDAGRVFVLFGGPGGTPASLDLEHLDGSTGFVIAGHLQGELLGCAVSAADVNGDGVDDLIVGAPSSDPELYHHEDIEVMHEGDPRGATYVFFGRDEWEGHLHADEADLTFVGYAPEGRAGAGAATADFNGDGHADLIMGAPDVGLGDGEAYVLFGGPGVTGEVNAADLNGANGLTFTGFPDIGGGGFTVAAGDLNGDGRADAALVSPNANAGAGAILLAFGRAAGPAAIDLSAPDGASAVRIDGLAAGDRLGAAIEIGDVNGDAIGDLVVSATRAGEPGREDAGVTYVVFGRTGGWDPLIDLAALDGDDGYAILGQAAGAAMGYDIAIGDVDGDRLGDIAIGGWEGGNQTGQTAVVLGRLALEAVERFGTLSADLLHGGLADDLLAGGRGDDMVLGHRGSDAISGGDGADRLIGGSGTDTLAGDTDDDLLRGGKGDDILSGGRGADSLAGGAGADRFVLTEAIYSRPQDPDVIADLEAHDLIDVSAIDADDSRRGDQAFVLVEFFTGARREAILSRVGDDTLLQLDNDGDAKANAAILILGDHTGHTGFIL